MQPQMMQNGRIPPPAMSLQGQSMSPHPQMQGGQMQGMPHPHMGGVVMVRYFVIVFRLRRLITACLYFTFKITSIR